MSLSASLQGLLEILMRNLHHHIAEHTDQTSVGIQGKTPVLMVLGQCRDDFVIEPQIEDGIHHPRHADGRATAHR